MKTVLLLADFRAQSALFRSSSIISELPKDTGESGVGASEIWLQANGFTQRVCSLLQFVLLFSNRAERVISLGVVRPVLDGEVKFLSRVVEIALLPQRYSESVMNVGLRRIEFRRFSKFG